MPLVCLADFKAHAQKQLSKSSWDFVNIEADKSITYNDNIASLKRICFHPRYLRDVSKVDTRTTIQGEGINAPICISPTAFHWIACLDREKNTARVTPAMFWKTFLRLIPWFQIYVQSDWDFNKQMIQKVETLVITVDLPVLGNRRGNRRNQVNLEANIMLKDL